jgi:hypothetical protein
MMTNRLHHGVVANKKANRRRLISLVLIVLSAICFDAEDGVAAALAESGEIALQLNDAFRTGLNGFRENDLSISAMRFGHHWTLEGKDPAGRAVERLTCLLCTEQEAISLAAFLGGAIRKKFEAKSPSQEEVDSSIATISIDGAPVPHYSTTKRTDTASIQDVPNADHAKQFRWAAVLAATGASSAAIGGVFLWMDGNCANSTCSEVHSLKAPGIGLLVSSALLETAAVLLFSIRRKKEALK